MVEGFDVAATDKAYKTARRLRRNLSLPEKLLWVRLRGSEIRFRRQHPIGPYVLDFYCPTANLAIEVDGFAHETGNRRKRDEERTGWLRAQGLEVLRINAKDVLADPGSVADALLRLCSTDAEPLHHPAAPDGPPPHRFATGRSE